MHIHDMEDARSYVGACVRGYICTECPRSVVFFFPEPRENTEAEENTIRPKYESSIILHHDQLEVGVESVHN